MTRIQPPIWSMVLLVWLLLPMAAATPWIHGDENLAFTAPETTIPTLSDKEPTESTFVDASEYSEGIMSSQEITKAGAYFDGYNLFVLREMNRSNNDLIRYPIVLTTMDGKIAFEGPPALANPAEFINSTTVLSQDYDEARLWNIYTNETDHLGLKGHHDYEYNHNNNTVFTIKAYNIEIGGTTYLYDSIEEYDLDGNLIWSINSSEFIPPEHWCPYGDLWHGIPDVTHGNTIFYDSDEDMIYFNCRNTNTFYKINHSSGEVVWSLGEYGDFQMFDADGNEAQALFYHAHGLDRIDDSTFLLFDNDYHNQTDAENKLSRMVEIKTNEFTMTANVSWKWTAPPDYYSGYAGDADRLPNGNRIGVFGTPDHPEADGTGVSDIGARIVEVNREGEIVWSMDYHHKEELKYYVHELDRVRLSPILTSNQNHTFSTEEAVILNWT
ncbi:MAG: hypothetical protein GF309_08655, partial [Candidatus Lokiarchaeota archaeon]|nr:hypothetical protein [Candidatus Lokiarchaeota archaeon]